MKKIFLLISILLLLNSPNLMAQVKPDKLINSKGPISISADLMEVDDASQIVTFSGRVIAQQGDLTISSNIMKVQYISSGTNNTGEESKVEKIECIDNVKVVDGERMAVANKAVYLAESLPKRIILTGQARVWQGEDSLTGHQITYYLDNNRSVVEGNKKERVRATYSNN